MATGTYTAQTAPAFMQRNRIELNEEEAARIIAIMELRTVDSALQRLTQHAEFPFGAHCVLCTHGKWNLVSHDATAATVLYRRVKEVGE